MKLFPGFGGASYGEQTLKIVRLLRKGCVNRPFFHISVQEWFKKPDEQAIEQIGSYDPYPNKYNEKLVAINFKRLEHWIKEGAILSSPVSALLGLAGYFPIHPKTYEKAWSNRRRISQLIKELRATVAELENAKPGGSSSLLQFSESSSKSTSSSSVENSEEKDLNQNLPRRESDSNPDETTPESPETKVDK